MFKKSLAIAAIFAFTCISVFASGQPGSTRTSNNTVVPNLSGTAVKNTSKVNYATDDMNIIQSALMSKPELQNTMTGLLITSAAKFKQNSTGTYNIILKPQANMFVIAESKKYGTAVNQISTLKLDSFAIKYASRFGFTKDSVPKTASTEDKFYLNGLLSVTINGGNIATFEPKTIQYERSTGNLIAEDAKLVGDMTIDSEDILNTSGSVVVALATNKWKAVNENELNATALTTKNADKVTSFMTLRNLEVKGEYQPNVALFQFKYIPHSLPQKIYFNIKK